MGRWRDNLLDPPPHLVQREGDVFGGAASHPVEVQRREHRLVGDRDREFAGADVDPADAHCGGHSDVAAGQRSR